MSVFSYDVTANALNTACFTTTHLQDVSKYFPVGVGIRSLVVSGPARAGGRYYLVFFIIGAGGTCHRIQPPLHGTSTIFNVDVSARAKPCEEAHTRPFARIDV
jgi:hypothetical protein